MTYVAHVAGWEPYHLRDLEHGSWVESVLSLRNRQRRGLHESEKSRVSEIGGLKISVIGRLGISVIGRLGISVLGMPCTT